MSTTLVWIVVRLTTITALYRTSFHISMDPDECRDLSGRRNTSYLPAGGGNRLQTRSAGGKWRPLLDHVEMLPRPPRVIVAFLCGDGRLWAEVLNLGGHDVLTTPFDTNEVHHVTSHAVEPWHREVEVMTNPHGGGECAFGPQAAISAYRWVYRWIRC